MEKHICKLCFRSFANGRALGGHMRCHFAAAPAAGAPTNSSASSFEPEIAGEEKGSGLSYVLRENPRKSFRLVDPEFFAVEAGSSIVQDRESETESPRPQIHGRRSKRQRCRPATEPESSVSITSPEEDVAISLMMLSRDNWKAKSSEEDLLSYSSEEDDEEIQIAAGSRRSNHRPPPPPQRRGRYQCETCKRSFRSYQALGGHRASHKKHNSCSPAMARAQIAGEGSARPNADPGGKIHECPICFRVFGSGQALGGHKRSHFAAAAITITSPPPPTPKFGASLFDLNLPAPMDDEVPELSAVSDAEFIANRHRFY